MGDAGEVAVIDYRRPEKPGRKLIIDGALAVFAVASAAVMYLWCGLSPRVLFRFDTTGLDPQDTIDVPLPIDHIGTLWRCIGPAGWIVAAGVFGLALVIGFAARSFPWWARMCLATLPVLLILVLFSGWQLRAELRPIALAIYLAQYLIAALAGVLAPRVARLVALAAHQEGLPS